MTQKIVRQIDDRNRITLPPEIMEALRLESNGFVILTKDDGKIRLSKGKIIEE